MRQQVLYQNQTYSFIPFYIYVIRFTRAVLGSSLTNHQDLIFQLQKVLMFLRYSYRAAYSPASFIKASRPPWFEAGRQQDCSEFLR